MVRAWQAGDVCAKLPAMTLTEPIAAGSLAMRPATTGDLDRITEIINDPPAAEAVHIAGGRDRAMRAARLLVRQGISLRLEHTTVAELDGAIAGVIDAGPRRGDVRVTPMLVARLIAPLLLIIGPAGVLRLVRSRSYWARVSFDGDPDSYYIAELDVDSRHRNRGIGGALLDLAEERARRDGCPRMSLTTNINNPARRLYERHGFSVVAERRDADYERAAGSPGRVLMAKSLG